MLKPGIKSKLMTRKNGAQSLPNIYAIWQTPVEFGKCVLKFETVGYIYKDLILIPSKSINSPIHFYTWYSGTQICDLLISYKKNFE